MVKRGVTPLGAWMDVKGVSVQGESGRIRQLVR